MTRTNREEYRSNQPTYLVVQNTLNVLEISSNFQGVLGHTNSCGDGRPLRVSKRSSNGEEASRNEAGLRVEEVVLCYRCLPLAGLDVHEARRGPRVVAVVDFRRPGAVEEALPDAHAVCRGSSQRGSVRARDQSHLFGSLLPASPRQM